MKRLLLCLGTASLLAAAGCEMHQPMADSHDGHDAHAPGEKAGKSEEAPARDAHQNPPQFFPRQ